MTPLQRIREHPSGVLLVVQLLSLLVYPALGDQRFGHAVLGILGVVVLALAVAAVRRTPALTWVAALLGLPVVVLTVMEAFQPGGTTISLISALFHAAFYFYTGYALIRYMFGDTIVTTDELFATGATFTVVAWGFAYLYTATDLVNAHAFAGGAHPHHWIELLFLSVTTLTSTGLSDITPLTAYARSFVMVEQIGGMLYLALVVARVTALTANRAVQRDR